MNRRARDAHAGGKQSQRQLRVGEEVRHALARIVQREPFRDPDLSNQSITVTEVRTSPDLRLATALVIPLGGGDGARTVVALARAAAYLRSRIAAEVHLRFVPELRFVLDESFANAAHVDAVLDDPRVARDLQRADDDHDGA